MKIDTEGCEVPIIKTLSNYYELLSVIYLEYHSVSDKKELLRLLENTHTVIGDKVVGMTEALVDRRLIGKKYCAVTGKKEFRLFGYNRDPQITITQTAPLDLQINGLIAELIF